jgi:predicted CXXCH cytochrome family protein
MKSMKLLFTFLYVAAFASVGFGQITGTKHDFHAQAWSGGEICKACHTPHNGKAVTGAVLWNHRVTTATYTTYTSSTTNATMGQPSGTSKLCLSCHDGTVALEDFGSVTTGTTFVTGSALVGIDLSNDHPVSFTYDAALVTADGGLKAATDVNVAPLLFGGKVECASCHDVHNSAGIAKLLRVSNASSALCLTCHNK